MLRRWMIGVAPVLALCATLALSSGTASANENVLQAIAHENHVIGASGALSRVLNLERADRTRPYKLYRAFDALADRYARAATFVSHSTAASARQARGRTEWVRGVRTLAGAIYELGHAFHIIHTDPAQAARLTRRAQVLVVRAEHEVKASVHLL